MLQRIAQVFGVVFVLIGILGFVPALTPNGLLFGVFAVNGMHNLVHLLTGIIAFIVAYTSAAASRRFFQVLTVVYGLVAILGFAMGHGYMFGMAHNPADAWLHLAITLASLYYGFIYHRAEYRQAAPAHTKV